MLSFEQNGALSRWRGRSYACDTSDIMGCYSILNHFSLSAYKLPHPQCSAPELLLSANLYLRSTVDTALEIWQQLSSERD
jgi:hypothetical protein